MMSIAAIQSPHSRGRVLFGQKRNKCKPSLMPSSTDHMNQTSKFGHANGRAFTI